MEGDNFLGIIKKKIYKPVGPETRTEPEAEHQKQTREIKVRWKRTPWGKMSSSVRTRSRLWGPGGCGQRVSI